MNIKTGLPSGTINHAVNKSLFENTKKGNIEQVLKDTSRYNLQLSTLTDNDNNYGQNLMFRAAEIKNEEVAIDMINFLISKDVKPDPIDAINQTPLFYAAREGHNKVIDLFVMKGCLPD